jgi:two-component sensor histidine kinase
MFGLRRGSLTTIRVRLAAALAAALLPVLVLGVTQSVIGFQREGRSLRVNLGLAAERSAATARARIESANVLLETLAPGAVGYQCAQRLEQVRRRIPGYLNLIRFDRQGRVVCASGSVPYDQQRALRPWFRELAQGDQLTITRDGGQAYSQKPSVLTAARATRPDGMFDGAFAAVISLSSLQPSVKDPSLPKGAEVGLVEKSGRYITTTQPWAFPALPSNWREEVAAKGTLVWYGRDAHGRERVYAAAPMVREDVYVVLSAKSPGILSWAWLNPLTGIAFPLLTFGLALAFVLAVTDRVVVRWITYLQRIAALYAKGRLSVRPVQAEQMPPEIRELAETLEDMADAIVGRDASLRDNLAQKDALMREIHHRVKNNLQVISSLLNMQQRSLTDPAARSAMSDTRQRITALALIYRALYQGPDLKRVDLRPFLEELTAQLVSGELVHGPAVRTELSVDPLVIDPDRLAPLALFAVEAISVAQKRPPDERGTVLSVDFHVSGDQAELMIKDLGGATAAEPAGVARTLMTAFARQLGGALSFEHPPAGGLVTRLAFPTPAEPPRESHSAGT